MGEKISVVIPTFNRASFIERTVKSALGQTCQQVEVIVVDDGSTDNTRAVLEPFFSRPGFIYHYQENKGRSIARNEGAALASGDWIMYLDSDDYLVPDALERLSKKIESERAIDLVVANFSFVRAGYPPFHHGRSFEAALAQQNFLLELFEDRYCLTKTGTYLVRRSTEQASGGFNRTYEPCEDLDYAIRLLSRANVAVLPDTVLYVERHEGNTDNREMLLAMVKIFQDYLADRKVWEARLTPVAGRRAVAAMKFRIANWLYELDRHGAAFDYYFGAVRTRPSLLANRFMAKQLLTSLWLPPKWKNHFKKNNNTSSLL